MARNMYGATSADFTLTSGGRVVPGATLTVWTARTGGTQVTDLLDADSVACTTVTSGADGSVVFYGPNNEKSTLWLDSGQGSRIAVRPVDITGETGATPALTIGTVTTGTAAATLTGTDEEPVLSLVLPSAGANGVDTAAIVPRAIVARPAPLAPAQPRARDRSHRRCACAAPAGRGLRRRPRGLRRHHRLDQPLIALAGLDQLNKHRRIRRKFYRQRPRHQLIHRDGDFRPGIAPRPEVRCAAQLHRRHTCKYLRAVQLGHARAALKLLELG